MVGLGTTPVSVPTRWPLSLPWYSVLLGREGDYGCPLCHSHTDFRYWDSSRSQEWRIILQSGVSSSYLVLSFCSRQLYRRLRFYPCSKLIIRFCSHFERREIRVRWDNGSVTGVSLVLSPYWRYLSYDRLLKPYVLVSMSSLPSEWRRGATRAWTKTAVRRFFLLSVQSLKRPYTVRTVTVHSEPVKQSL